MQPEPSEAFNTESRASPSLPTPFNDQHGFPDPHGSPNPSVILSDGMGARDRSGSEWSLSHSPGSSSPAEAASGLSPLILPSRDERVSNALDGLRNLSLDALRDDHDGGNTPIVLSGLSALPEGDHPDTDPYILSMMLMCSLKELLFHIISHLPAMDMMNIKLVSRRFYMIVCSPIAWMHAFAKFFPGQDSLKASADTVAEEQTTVSLRSTIRLFTRLSARSSWKSEYLLRTKLLRCLVRGRPALPFAAPVPGRANRGYATAIFGCRQHPCADRLFVDFGESFDKRRPMFMHGQSGAGTVSVSDRHGKLESWGIFERLPFKRASIGLIPWGLGNGLAVGVPNQMDIAYPFGMVYGEGAPDGRAWFMSTNEKHGRYLAPFLSLPDHAKWLPRVNQEDQSTTCVHISKTLAVHRATNGAVGMLVGSSNGILSSFSIGSMGARDQRRARGELTARWPISPGVPIIAISVDADYSAERHQAGRIWAVVLNALGEVYYTSDLPEVQEVPRLPEGQLDHARELAAWTAGRSVLWKLVKPTARIAREASEMKTMWHEHITPESIEQGATDVTSTMFKLESAFKKRPIDIQSEFQYWDMRRSVEVDFAADDGKNAGETIVVCERGYEDGLPAAIRRFVRSRYEPAKTSIAEDNIDMPKTEESRETLLFGEPTWSFPTGSSTTLADHSERVHERQTYHVGFDQWFSSQLLFARYKNITINVSAMDTSKYAVTTLEEDEHYAKTPGSATVPPRSNIKQPGERARLFAVGTGAGTVFVWNIRAPASSFVDVENAIDPVRIIHTQSLSVSALALTSLYLVHGGPEGLVQAWDPLASSTEPLRTLSSRMTLNARRRAAIANRTASVNENQTWNPLSHAVTSICLDPDPTVLRGAIAIGMMIRYFSYSSSTAEDGQSAAKRKARRTARGLNGPGGVEFVDHRKNVINRHVSEELAYRAFAAREEKANAREERRIAGRYGLNLLGEGATEEEFLAYATMLSQEEEDRRRASASRPKLTTDASIDEVEQYKSTLSPEDSERWKFASWQERFEMPSSEPGSTPRVPTASDASDTAGFDNNEVVRAIEMSLGQGVGSSSKPAAPAPAVEDEAVAEAIRQSLGQQPRAEAVSSPSSRAQEDEDLAKALSLSLAGQPGLSPPSSPLSPDDDGFPVLGSSPSARPVGGAWGKGKRRVP